MKIKFWGVRGSIGSALSPQAIYDKIRGVLALARPADVLNDQTIDQFLNSLSFSLTRTYGGNTTCLEIRNDEGYPFCIDAGTGIRNYGNALLGEGFGEGKGEMAMFFTHTHWDHIQGLPFFVPMYIPGNTFHVHGVGVDIEERLIYQTPFSHFPMPFEKNLSTRHFYRLEDEDSTEWEGVKVSTKSMRHPGTSYAYSFEQNGKKIIYGSDAEFNVDEMENILSYIDFFKDADVLVFDTQYTFEESIQRIDWGHSSASIATDIALKCGVKKLVLFHHDPSYSDDKLDAVYLRALKYQEMMARNSSMEIIMAYEGLEIEV
jgi:phosphoribosyl 1,2-cyclic phosphodiesterase